MLSVLSHCVLQSQLQTGTCDKVCTYHHNTPTSIQHSVITPIHPQAYEECKANGLDGDFLDACTHDRAFSGDTAFVTSAKEDKDSYESAKSELDSGGGGSSSAQHLRGGMITTVLALLVVCAM